MKASEKQCRHFLPIREAQRLGAIGERIFGHGLLSLVNDRPAF
jgi:hypothetical protein